MLDFWFRPQREPLEIISVVILPQKGDRNPNIDLSSIMS